MSDINDKNIEKLLGIRLLVILLFYIKGYDKKNLYERALFNKASGLRPANVKKANYVTTSFQGRNNSFLLTGQ